MQGLGETTAMLARLRRSMPGGLDTGGASPDGMIETGRFGENPGALRMLSYAPPSLPPGAPLVVVLHGCTQNGQGYARDAGWMTLADRLGFAVLAPEQRAANNPNRCFNWFEPGDARPGQGEAASIAAMVATALAVHKGDPRQVFVTGLSAGGAMSAVMLAAYPELFAGGAIIAGLPYGVARGVPDALRIMGQGDGRSGAALGALVGRRTGALRLSIWHGDADHTVNRANAKNLADQWAAATELDAGPARVERLNGRTRSVWHDRAGGSVIELNIVHGLGHGTPLSTKGPDGVGRPAPYMLETGISSTVEIARFWGLDAGAARSTATDQAPAQAARQDAEAHDGSSAGRPDQSAAHARPSGLAGQVLDAVSAHVPADVRAVIAKALRAAGLMH